MARTKRRFEKKAYSLSKTNYRAGIYVRLSHERTESYREKSSSPDAQVRVCKDYAKKNDISVVNVYEDYEYTGTNFDRPAFNNMMKDIREQRINCIMVRDLSRLGREHLEMGRLIDKVFPFLGVRFISISDKLDTLNGIDNNKSFEVVIKNIVNDMYAKDISKKIKSAYRQRAKAGYFIGSVAPYAYKTNKTKNGIKLVVDKACYHIVREIFDMATNKYNPTQIARKLNQNMISPPTLYRETGRLKRKQDENQWVATTIRCILSNEVYAGHLFQYKNDDEINVKNTHEAIVSEDDFNLANKWLKLPKKVAKSVVLSNITAKGRENENRYKNLIFLRDTDKVMYRQGKSDCNHKMYYKFISQVSNGTIFTEKNVMIYENVLDEIIIDTINKMISSISRCDDIKNNLAVIIDLKNKEIKNEMSTLQWNLEQFRNKVDISYERYALDKISKDPYIKLKEEYLIKISTYKKEILKTEEKINKLKEHKKKAYLWIDSLFESENKKRLDTDLLNSLISRIGIYGKNQVDISFKFDVADILGGEINE